MDGKKPVKLVWNGVSGVLEQPNVVYDILYNGYSCAGAVVFEVKKYDLPLIKRSPFCDYQSIFMSSL